VDSKGINEGSFWEGVGCSISQEFRDEVHSGVVIEVGVNNDDDKEGTNKDNNGATQQRDKFHDELYKGIALCNRAQSYDLSTTVNLSACGGAETLLPYVGERARS